MGWNDHVTFAETECLDCGEISAWEYWDEVGKCPDCGSTRGRILDEEEYE
jgi:Zn finger protein HypA/HybF involved in hydrogenase expression